MATAEKALCDMLYKLSPSRNQKELTSLIFDFLRIDERSFYDLDMEKIAYLADRYHSTNLKLLKRIVKKNDKTNNQTDRKI